MPFAVAVMAINVLVSRDGATVIFRGPNLPWPGQLDFTLEALVYGGVLGAADPGDLRDRGLPDARPSTPTSCCAALRRLSLRSGVTAALAMRLFGVLRRDAHRLADAQRCLPGGGASRMAVLHAVTTGALDRATDVAATLEVRGFGVGAPPAADAAAVVAPRPRVRRLDRSRCSAIAAGVLLGALGRVRGLPAPATRR